MEDNRLMRRGTVAVGALTIIAIFMIATTCIATLIIEYNRYIYNVKTVTEKILLRGKEEVSAKQISEDEVTVTNRGSVTSLIIGVFAVNQNGGDIRYVRLPTPLTVKILSSRNLTLPEAIPTGWRIAVLTAYGNIFWEDG